MKSRLKVIFSYLTVIVICFTLFTFNVSASEAALSGSITVSACDNNTQLPVNGISFRLYKFADYSNGIFTFTDKFADNGMECNNFSDSYMPVHLMRYAEEKAVEYTAKVIENDSSVTFQSLSEGTYLIVADSVPSGYSVPAPFIVTIPFIDEATGLLSYDITASPKIMTRNTPTEEKVYISVKKQWDGNSNHPESVTVTLLKDYKAQETVTLNADNNWYYRWDNLDESCAWSVVEENVPDNYTAAYSFSQMSVIITNTSEGSEEETTLPDNPPPPESTTKEDELIHTGQLNWPVPVLSVAGLLLFSIGWAMLNLGKKEEDRI